jgi:hypothetical protein
MRSEPSTRTRLALLLLALLSIDLTGAAQGDPSRQDVLRDAIDEDFAALRENDPERRLPLVVETSSGPDTSPSVARRTFELELRDDYAERLGVRIGSGGQVHHAIELQTLKKYPGVFTSEELNDFANMRGIPPERTPDGDLDPRYGRRQLHNSAIRSAWDRCYETLRAEIETRNLRPHTEAYRQTVRTHITSTRDYIDWRLGQFFSEQRRQYFRGDLPGALRSMTRQFGVGVAAPLITNMLADQMKELGDRMIQLNLSKDHHPRLTDPNAAILLDSPVMLAGNLARVRNVLDERHAKLVGNHNAVIALAALVKAPVEDLQAIVDDGTANLESYLDTLQTIERNVRSILREEERHRNRAREARELADAIGSGPGLSGWVYQVGGTINEWTKVQSQLRSYAKNLDASLNAARVLADDTSSKQDEAARMENALYDIAWLEYGQTAARNIAELLKTDQAFFEDQQRRARDAAAAQTRLVREGLRTSTAEIYERLARRHQYERQLLDEYDSFDPSGPVVPGRGTESATARPGASAAGNPGLRPDVDVWFQKQQAEAHRRHSVEARDLESRLHTGAKLRNQWRELSTQNEVRERMRQEQTKEVTFLESLRQRDAQRRAEIAEALENERKRVAADRMASDRVAQRVVATARERARNDLASRQRIESERETSRQHEAQRRHETTLRNIEQQEKRNQANARAANEKFWSSQSRLTKELEQRNRSGLKEIGNPTCRTRTTPLSTLCHGTLTIIER